MCLQCGRRWRGYFLLKAAWGKSWIPASTSTILTVSAFLSPYLKICQALHGYHKTKTKNKHNSLKRVKVGSCGCCLQHWCPGISCKSQTKVNTVLKQCSSKEYPLLSEHYKQDKVEQFCLEDCTVYRGCCCSQCHCCSNCTASCFCPFSTTEPDSVLHNLLALTSGPYRWEN